jgi:hypothetical protein
MRARRIILVLALGSLVGCTQGSSKPDLPPEEKHILKLAALYSDFRGKNGRPPGTMDELKSFAKRMGPEALKQRGIENIDDAFTSPRDHQPYKLAPPQPPKRGGPPMPMVVVYESTGVDGKRMVASGVGGGAFELDEEKLREYVPKP